MASQGASAASNTVSETANAQRQRLRSLSIPSTFEEDVADLTAVPEAESVQQQRARSSSEPVSFQVNTAAPGTNHDVEITQATPSDTYTAQEIVAGSQIAEASPASNNQTSGMAQPVQAFVHVIHTQTTPLGKYAAQDTEGSPTFTDQIGDMTFPVDQLSEAVTQDLETAEEVVVSGVHGAHLGIAPAQASSQNTFNTQATEVSVSGAYTPEMIADNALTPEETVHNPQDASECALHTETAEEVSDGDDQVTAHNTHAPEVIVDNAMSPEQTVRDHPDAPEHTFHTHTAEVVDPDTQATVSSAHTAEQMVGSTSTPGQAVTNRTNSSELVLHTANAQNQYGRSYPAPLPFSNNATARTTASDGQNSQDEGHRNELATSLAPVMIPDQATFLPSQTALVARPATLVDPNIETDVYAPRDVPPESPVAQQVRGPLSPASAVFDWEHNGRWPVNEIDDFMLLAEDAPEIIVRRHVPVGLGHQPYLQITRNHHSETNSELAPSTQAPTVVSARHSASETSTSSCSAVSAASAALTVVGHTPLRRISATVNLPALSNEPVNAELTPWNETTWSFNNIGQTSGSPHSPLSSTSLEPGRVVTNDDIVTVDAPRHANPIFPRFRGTGLRRVARQGSLRSLAARQAEEAVAEEVAGAGACVVWGRAAAQEDEDEEDEDEDDEDDEEEGAERVDLDEVDAPVAEQLRAGLAALSEARREIDALDVAIPLVDNRGHHAAIRARADLVVADGEIREAFGVLWRSLVEAREFAVEAQERARQRHGEVGRLVAAFARALLEAGELRDEIVFLRARLGLGDGE